MYLLVPALPYRLCFQACQESLEDLIYQRDLVDLEVLRYHQYLAIPPVLVILHDLFHRAVQLDPVQKIGHKIVLLTAKSCSLTIGPGAPIGPIDPTEPFSPGAPCSPFGPS